MHFQNPEILWFLFLLLIPVAIHLFNLHRYKLTYFSNTEVLRQIEQQTVKTRKLKHRIVLALRCLFVAALVLAFARPCRSNSNKDVINDSSSLTAVYIDNTMSMKSMAKKTTLLADAREAALNIVEGMGHSNRFVLITNSFELQNEYPMNRDEMIDRINSMQTEGSPVGLATVLSRADAIARQSGFRDVNVFLLSDFQDNILDVDDLKTSALRNVMALPFQSSNNSNIYIDSLWLDSPIVQPRLSNGLHISVVNDSDADVTALPASFYIDNELVATASVDIESHGDVELTMQFMIESSGAHRCRVEITDYPIVFDNDYKFVLDAKTGMKVVEIGNEPSRVADVFADDGQFSYTFVDVASLDYSALQDAQLIVLNTASEITSTLSRALYNALEAGKSVVVFPAGDGGNLSGLLSLCGPSIVDYDTVSMAVESVAQNNEFFSDVLLNMPQYADLPKVKAHCTIRPDAQSSILMTLQNGQPYLVGRQVGAGQFFLFAVSLDEKSGNLTDNSLFVPLLVKMTLRGGSVGDIAHTIGDDGMVRVSPDLKTNGLLHLRGDGNGFEAVVAPATRNGQSYISVDGMIPSAGFYELTDDGVGVELLAWNDNRSESVMRFTSVERVNEVLQRSGADNVWVSDKVDNPDRIVDEMVRDKGNYWFYLLLLALLALLAESLVLRLM